MDEPLQEQPARHRVQPLRGARARRACSGTGPFDEIDVDTAEDDPRRGRPAGPRRARGVVRGGPTAPRRCSTRRPTASDAGGLQPELPGVHGRRVVAAADPGRARRPARPRRRCCGRWPSWCSAPTRAVWMYACGPVLRRGIIHRNGTDRDKQIAQHMIDRRWGATMVLTEPDAGSDVGAGRTKAVPAGRRQLAHRGRQALHHLGRARHEREHHAPRARPPGRRRGRRRPRHQGTVLFVVPKHHFDLETGELTGERNGVYVTGVEKKMGIKVSTTCEVTFGEHEPGPRLAARRGARRHRADVPGDRERPDDGRHQGDRDPVDRLPERARVRQDPGAGPRPDAGRRTRPHRG